MADRVLSLRGLYLDAATAYLRVNTASGRVLRIAGMQSARNPKSWSCVSPAPSGLLAAKTVTLVAGNSSLLTSYPSS